MKSTYYPIILGSTVIQKDKTTFNLPEREVQVTIPQNLAYDLVRTCDGTHSIEAVTQHLSKQWSPRSIQKLLTTMVSLGVFTDSRDISPLLWKFASNPTAWSNDLNKHELNSLMLECGKERHGRPTHALRVVPNRFTKLLANRSSHRIFGEMSISKESLARILWSAYGLIGKNLVVGERFLEKRTVPSAGALYPSTLHLVLMKDINTVRRGIYRITSNSLNVVELKRVGMLNEKIGDVFVDANTLNTASGFICISTCVGRIASKYANRGILYGLMEAGHLAQNIHLAAQVEGVMTVEVGGFYEEKMAEKLHLVREAQPVITVVFGSRPEKNSRVLHPEITLESIVKELDIVPAKIAGFTLPFSMVFARITKPNGTSWWSCGRSENLKTARTKALAEAVEWYACGNVGALTEARYSSIRDSAIDPISMVKYLPKQFRLNSTLRPFSTTQLYEWETVTEIETGKKRLILADFVYFPYTPKFNNRYAFANSSGTAAHLSTGQATLNATLELVERETFMVMWLNKLRRRCVQITSIPLSFQKRIQALTKLGCRVRVVDLSLDLSPVLMVVAVNEKLPFLSCSAASTFEIVDGLDRALKEAEASIYSYLKNGSTRKIIAPEEVEHTMDHGAFYENKGNIRRFSFLLGDERGSVSLKEIEREQSIKTFDHLRHTLISRRLSLHTVDLTSERSDLSNLPYKVVKAFIPGMVPMSFGYCTEPLGLSRVRQLPITCGLRRRPIRLSELNMAPHPFT